MHKLGPVSEYADEGIYEFSLDDQSYLLIKHQGHYFCIENKCGHFGVPLTTGKVKDNTIYCLEHGIGFSLFDGQVKKSLGEECDAIKICKVVEQEGVLYSKLN